MDPLILARWQFAITTIYHFFFVPLTLGLAVLVAIMETQYVRTGDETWKRMTKFWGKLFLINFAMGVATGIVQEFQFGMNWSDYSRFVGDIFGAPLAIEALLAFFMESTFLGIWIFGWDKLSRKAHLATIWLVAIGANLSALWILIANSFMQEPVGYTLRNGRAEMTDFGALVANPHVWLQWPHVFFSALATAGFFILGISAFRLLRERSKPAVMQAKAPAAKHGARKPKPETRDRQPETVLFRRSFQLAAIAAIIGAVMVGGIGHLQGQHMVRTQPMKMAAAEALWNTEKPAALSLFAITDTANRKNVFALRIPFVLSLLSCSRTDCAVQGINELQAKYEAQYGAGNYIPAVVLIFWAFRGMVGAGSLMVALAAFALYLMLRKRAAIPAWFLRVLPFAIALPYLANSAGWIMTEMGRQPWIVFGVLKTQDAVSPNVPAGMVLASLLGFALLYAALIVADVYLLAKSSKADSTEVSQDSVSTH